MKLHRNWGVKLQFWWKSPRKLTKNSFFLIRQKLLQSGNLQTQLTNTIKSNLNLNLNKQNYYLNLYFAIWNPKSQTKEHANIYITFCKLFFTHCGAYQITCSSRKLAWVKQQSQTTIFPTYPSSMNWPATNISREWSKLPHISPPKTRMCETGEDTNSGKKNCLHVLMPWEFSQIFSYVITLIRSTINTRTSIQQ